MRASLVMALCSLWLFSTSAQALTAHMVWKGNCTRAGKPTANDIVLTVDYLLTKGPATGTLAGHDTDTGEQITNALAHVNMDGNDLTFDAPGIFRKQDVTRHYSGSTNDQGATVHGHLSQDGLQEPAECDFTRVSAEVRP